MGSLLTGPVPALELESVSVRRGALRVLGNLDLRLRAGDAWAIFGENGAGKSTLIQLVAGQLPPSSGTVWIAGRRAAPDLPGRLFADGIRLLSLLEQPGLAPGISALENVALPLRYHASALSLHPEQATALAREALSAVAVYPPELHSLPDRLSFGLQRRVALARILALRPHVVLLDDPLLGVDTESSLVIERVLRAWARDPNLTLLCATGDRSLAARIGALGAHLSADGLCIDPTLGVSREPASSASETESQLIDAAGDAGMLH